jgi:23S rRNA (uridine2552-2'-O)-methyltransferase
MDPLPHVQFIQGDFTLDATLLKLNEWVPNNSVDLLLSDMAPNMSGTVSVDIPSAMYLAELAVDFAVNMLKPGGNLLIKVFHGEGFDVLLKLVRSRFQTVKVRKPKASRPRSRETYLMAKGFLKQ